MPQVPLPDGLNVKVGDLATIQVVEVAKSGAGLYNCVDIIFALPENVNPVNETNCFNSTDISFKDPFSNAATTTTSTPAGASRTGLWGPLSCSTSSACPTQTPCPKANEVGSKEGASGVGFPLGVLALGILGLKERDY
ncbi:uncharacterized protein K444DRAFT_629927 [Hyaloscypha bicolor E]|uniref:Copper acquisition factor BIM1-like domain-containing protein n=1 Tax=Hyaloscypha bicolor E TaxID=1095630 RepID=A0A2J6T928_9HELO|nr:uncharacterized protein K444DRAFT_629927 [Hyaloscypha bicolor E]PMD59511.1 hypothetical protein K444DRAFT_629927 [Hyaloscypha bicolor E]